MKRFLSKKQKGCSDIIKYETTNSWAGKKYRRLTGAEKICFKSMRPFGIKK
jgi:hypothetical protein